MAKCQYYELIETEILDLVCTLNVEILESQIIFIKVFRNKATVHTQYSQNR